MHPNVIMVDNSAIGFTKKMDRVLSLVTNLIKHPNLKYARKYLLPSKVEIPENISKYVFNDRVTFLVTN